MHSGPVGEAPEQIEEYELPSGEALLAGTMALMTGYGQALQAERDPSLRLAVNLRIAENLEHLSRHAALSPPFRAVSGRLHLLWQQMARCTAEAGGLPPAAGAGMRRLH